jgi:taurine dioxygenase
MMVDGGRPELGGPRVAEGDLDIRPLASAIGIEVRGLDLAHRLDDALFGKIREAWEQNCIALFRGQRLSAVKQILFARRFGPLDKPSGGPPAVLYVTNARGNDGAQGILPEGPIDFHSDQSYLDVPSMATMLYAIDVPGRGGNTLYANGYRAFDALPEALRQRLAGRRALHAYDYENSPTRRPARMPANSKPVTHPIFRTHPSTGRVALYVNRLMTWSIIDMPAQESRETLEILFDHQERPEFVYEHVWEAGDLMLWDNRSCLHARTDFDPRECRRLRRITVMDDAPF